MSEITVTVKQIGDEFSYPCLMINESSCIVLATSENTAIKLDPYGTNDFYVGYQMENFSVSDKDFNLFHGSVTLTQG